MIWFLLDAIATPKFDELATGKRQRTRRVHLCLYYFLLKLIRIADTLMQNKKIVKAFLV
jgi:hypothetical protein